MVDPIATTLEVHHFRLTRLTSSVRRAPQKGSDTIASVHVRYTSDAQV
jgi:hypothetical protein